MSFKTFACVFNSCAEGSWCVCRSDATDTALQKTLDMIRFKCWYYETALADGNEDRIHAMLPDKLPPEIQALYDHGHS